MEESAKSGSVFFYAQILSVKTMIGRNKLTVKLQLNTLFLLVEINITPFEYIKLDLSRFRAHI